MRIIETKLEGVLIIELDVFKDNRGFFTERFNEKKFSDAGLPTEFPQDNHSRSAPGVIRGLHMQHTPPQGKLVGAISGSIYDVAVDVRPNSKTFGQYVGVELSGDNGKLLWIPGGFAHGFSVTGSSHADVYYKVTALYNKEGEIGIKYDDPELAINWGVKTPIVSDRDKQMMSFSEYKKNPPVWR